jgi:CheY-like chemotaxis protein
MVRKFRMTSNQKFEALLISQDEGVVRGMSQIMEELSIQVDVCMLSTRAADLLGKRDIDLLVVDWDTSGGSDLVKTIRRTVGPRVKIAAVVKPGIVEELALQAGADGVVYKPLTKISKAEFHCHVYHRLIAERRRERRQTVGWLVAAADLDGNSLPVAVTNISETGIGLSFAGEVLPENMLKFKVLLPGTSQIIRFDARIVWTKPDKIAGAEFVEISAGDSDVLRKWLQKRQQDSTVDSDRGAVSIVN